MGNNISDTFYPDNPNRRNRANELYYDVQAIHMEFKELHETYERIMQNMEPQMNELLDVLGFRSVDEIVTAAEAILTGESLEKFREIQNRLDTMNKIDGVIAGVAAIVSLTSAALIGVLVVFSVITVATGGKALLAVGLILLLISLAVLLAGIIEGARIRDELRENIKQNFDARREGKLLLEQLRVLTYWSTLMNALILSIDVTKGRDWILSQFRMFGTLLEGPKAMYDAITIESIDKKLYELDNSRGSWMKEDPPSTYQTSTSPSFEYYWFETGNSLDPRFRPSIPQIPQFPTDGRTQKEGLAKIRLESISSESKSDSVSGIDDPLTLEMETTVSENSALVYLKKDEDYITLVDDGSKITTRRVVKDDAEYFAETNDYSASTKSGSVTLSDLSAAGEGGRIFYAAGHFE